MPITLLDIILLVVMMISALLAMVRGFMREVLSIAAWVAAALATVYTFPKLVPLAKQYFTNDIVANAAVVGGVFLGTLLVVTIITLIVVVGFLFLAWLVPDRSQPEWVRNAKSRVVLKGTGDWLMSMLPDDPEGYLRKLKRPKPEEEPQDPPTRGRGALDRPLGIAQARAQATGYDRFDRQAYTQASRGRSGKTALTADR